MASNWHLPPKVVSGLLRFLQWLAVTVGIYVWWAGMMFLVSVFLVNVWRVSWEQILIWSAVLTGVCSAGYVAVMVLRDRRGS